MICRWFIQTRLQSWFVIKQVVTCIASSAVNHPNGQIHPSAATSHPFFCFSSALFCSHISTLESMFVDSPSTAHCEDGRCRIGDDLPPSAVVSSAPLVVGLFFKIPTVGTEKTRDDDRLPEDRTHWSYPLQDFMLFFLVFYQLWSFYLESELLFIDFVGRLSYSVKEWTQA